MKAHLCFIYKIGLLGLLIAFFSTASASDQINVKYVDRDGDKQADSILLVKDNLIFAGSIKKSKITTFSVRKLSSYELLVTYFSNAKKFDLTYGYATKDKIFNGHPGGANSQACLHSNGPGLKNLEEIGQTEISGAPDDCSAEFRKSNKIKSAMDDIVKHSDEMSNCISFLDVTASDAWFNLEDELNNINICGSNNISRTSSEACAGVFDANKKTVKISRSCLREDLQTKNILQHELLHAAGIFDEAAIECISNHCPNAEQFSECIKKNDRLALSSNSTGDKNAGAIATISLTSPSGSATANATAQIAANTTIQVPRQIAATSVPQPSVGDLRVTGGSRTFSVPANSNTFPAQMIRFAENAIMPTTAYASQNKASSAKISASAPVGATKSARIAATTVRPALSRGIASASPANSPVSSASAGINIPAVDAASAARSGKVAARSGAASPAKNNASRSSGSGVAGTSVTGGAKSSSTGNSRNVASPSSKVYSTTELVSILKQDSYPEVKKRLQQDEAFIEALKTNSITIYNTKGEQIGSPSGRIIFSDTGNRFIQGK